MLDASDLAHLARALIVFAVIATFLVLAGASAAAAATLWQIERTEHGVRFSASGFLIEVDTAAGTIRKVQADGKPLVWANSQPLLRAALIESEAYDQRSDYIADARLVEAAYAAERVEYAAEEEELTFSIGGSLTFPGEDALRFEAIFRARAGEHALRAEVALRPVGAFSHRYIREVSLRLPLAVNYRKRIVQGGDQGFTWETRYFYQYHLSPTGQLLVNPDRNEWRLFGIDQTSPVSYQLWRAESERTAPLVMQQGVHAPGWAAVYDEEGGVLVAYRKMHTLAPKALRVHAWDRGELVVMLHPDSVRAVSLDSRIARERLFDAVHSIDFLFFEGRYAAVNPPARLAAMWGLPSLASDPPYRPVEKFMRSHDAWLPAAMSDGDLSPWITGGVALPRGKVSDPYGVRVLREGRELSYQAQPLAYWPDGSIKWLLLTFRDDVEAEAAASPGGGDACCESVPFDVTFRDGSRRRYELQYAAAAARPAGQVRVERSEEGVTVDTGPLRIELGRGVRWIRQIALHGEVIVQTDGETQPLAFVDFLRTVEPYTTMTTHPAGAPDPGPVVIERIEVENDGPHRAVIYLEGRAESAEPPRVIIRLEAYGGQTFLRMNHTVEFTHKDPRRVFLRQMGIRLPVMLEKSAQRVLLGGEGTPTRLDEWQAAGLRQITHTEYAHWRLHGGAYDEVEHNNRALGWIDVADGRRGVMVAIRNMWQQAPNELAAFREDGALTAYFWPDSAPLMDVRRYSEYPHASQGESTGLRPNDWVETSYYPNDPFVGLSRSHEVLWFFHDAGVDGEQLGAVAADFQSPPLVYMGEAWYRENGLLLPQPDPELFPRVTENRSNVVAFWLYHQKLFGWYGKWHYGDIQHHFNTGYGWILPPNVLEAALEEPEATRYTRQRSGTLDYAPQHHWAYDNGRWGWTNTEGLPGLFFQREYLRTGDREIYFLAEASARYARDVVIRHSGRWFGRGTRHGVQPWSDGNHEERQTVHSEFRFHHYLSGDMRSRDVALKLLEAHYLTTDISIHAAHSGRLYGILTAWEMTGDPRLGDILRRYVRTFITPNGIAGSPRVSFPDVSLSEQGDVNTDSMFFHVFGAVHALLEYYYLTGDEELRQGLVKMAEALMQRLPSRPGSANPSWKTLAFAAKHADDPELFRSFLNTWFNNEAWLYAYKAVTASPAHWAGPTAYLPLGVPSIHFWINALPYVMSAFDSEPPLTSAQKEQLERLEQTGAAASTRGVSWQSEYDRPEFDDYLGRWRPWKVPLRIVLPDALADGARLQGLVPLDLTVTGGAEGIESVQILVDGEPVYSGAAPARPGEVTLNTYELADGRHELKVILFHEEHGRFVETRSVLVSNWWRISDDLRPPITGFFGTLDRLHVDHKSEGWLHAEDRPEAFFGDATRLVRRSRSEEYLVWATPSLREVEVQLYARDAGIEKGVTLAVSGDGKSWHTVPYGPEGVRLSVVETSDEGWHLIELRLSAFWDEPVNWLRITLTEALPAENVQLGRVELRGWRTD